MGINQQSFSFLNSLSGHSDYFDVFVLFCAQHLWWFSVVVLSIYVWRFVPAVQKWRTFGYVIGGSFMSYSISVLLKYIVASPRPFLVFSEITPLFYRGGLDAFPSSHTAFMFALATASFLFGRSVGLLLLISALLVGLSRIIAGVHWPVDIVGGFILGLLIGYLWYRYALKSNHSKLDKTANNL